MKLLQSFIQDLLGLEEVFDAVKIKQDRAESH